MWCMKLHHYLIDIRGLREFFISELAQSIVDSAWHNILYCGLRLSWRGRPWHGKVGIQFHLIQLLTWKHESSDDQGPGPKYWHTDSIHFTPTEIVSFNSFSLGEWFNLNRHLGVGFAYLNLTVGWTHVLLQVHRANQLFSLLFSFLNPPWKFLWSLLGLTITLIWP